MKSLLRAAFLLLSLNVVSSAETTATPPSFDINVAERFANLALACVHKEYPNHISHTLNSDADVQAPRKLTPAFYGCYDWRSSERTQKLIIQFGGYSLVCSHKIVVGEDHVPTHQLGSVS